MAVLSGATASGRNFYCNTLPNSWSVLYTSPAQTSNVTSPSATAYIKEIVIANTTSSAVTMTIGISASSTPGNLVAPLVPNATIGANDSKILTGLNTMLPAGWTIQGNAGAASSITVTISGVEVQ